MNLNLVDQLTLLALDDEKGNFVADSFSFAYGLAGAIILELSLQNKIEIREKKIEVNSHKTCGDLLLDHFMDQIRNSKKKRDIQSWVQIIGDKLSFVQEETVKKLIGDGILRKKEEKILWVFSNDKYPTINAKPENELRKRLNDILLNDRKLDLKESMLISLIDMCSLNKEVFGKEGAKEYEKKIKAIIENAKLSSEVGKAVQEIHDALMMVIVMMLTTTTIINN
ncbi:GPP34 family phosphoprotein [Labilibaculum sp. DW002]|uniref:GPP34 family phosphoprotein n=1 Tax=Paralabilibaculum antarcticum TaxID=2912572 RepID=A0ABT5VPH0_9BACT|nr:GPP34 family phosphoprotein [Labilibaculum sp. DW002]MDE5417337.1 GPP34 family phosphoprotein [Labilibaculum sp. DW002]